MVGTWDVRWTRVDVATPGYTGPTFKVTYNELNKYIENWYFAPDVGPVKIEAIRQADKDLDPPLILELLDHSLNVASAARAIDPHVSIRDLIVAQAGTTIGLNVDQWNAHYARATGLSGPSLGCIDASARAIPLPIDVYLALIGNDWMRAPIADRLAPPASTTASGRC